MDWGTGSGILSIAAARIEAVVRVFGLDIVAGNLDVARENGRLNGVADKTKFFHTDSFSPIDRADADAVAALKGSVRFIVTNPPASAGDDGCGFRRCILRESRDFLTEGGVVLMSISYQYGERRIASLTDDTPGFTHGGVLETTDLVPFDLARPDLLAYLRTYVEEEQRGGLGYEFQLPGEQGNVPANAQTAMAFFERTGQSPLSKWQMHLFEYQAV